MKTFLKLCKTMKYFDCIEYSIINFYLTNIKKQGGLNHEKRN